MIEFSPSFPLEELELKINEGYFNEEVYTYLLETLKEDSNDSKELKSGEISPYGFFTLEIMERDKAWRSHYISSQEHETVDKEIIDLLKNRIDMLFAKAKTDLDILEGSFTSKTINQIRSKNGLELIANGDCHFIKINDNKETALEVSVQEQHTVVIRFDEAMLNAKLKRINQLQKELKQEINSLPSTVKVTYQNC